MSINLRAELIKLLNEEGLGRLGLLRKTTGTAPLSKGGEYDPADPRYWEGRSYLDYKVKYYYTPTMVAEIKSVLGSSKVDDEIVFLAANPDDPAPTVRDTIVPLKHDLDGNVLEDGVGTNRYFVDEGVGFIKINSVLEYWADTNGQTVFYAVSGTRSRTGWSGSA